MKLQTLAVACASAVVLAACTTTEKVSVQQPGDRAMTCTQLRSEFTRLDNVSRDAEKDQGVNGANVAAVLLFWPAAVGNWLSADEAKDLVQRRRDHLMVFFNEKGCDNPANADLRVMVPSSLLSPVAAGSL